MYYSSTLLFAILASSFVGTVHAGPSPHCAPVNSPSCTAGHILLDSQDTKWSEHLGKCGSVDYQVFLLVEKNHGNIVVTPQAPEGKECIPMMFDSDFVEGDTYATKRIADLTFTEIKQEDMLYLGTKSFHEIEEAFQLASTGDGIYDVAARQTCANFVLSFFQILNFPINEDMTEYNAQRLAEAKDFVDKVRKHPETKKQAGGQMHSDLDLMRHLTKYYLSED